MAGVFENQDIAAPQGGISPQQPVQKVSDAGPAVAAVQGIASLVGTGMQLFQAQNQANIKRQKDTASAGFASYLTNLNGAVESGQLSQAQAQRMQRAKFNQLIAAHPEYTEDLVALNSGVTKSAGLGDTLAQGTAVEQQYQADLKTASAKGWIQQGMTEDQQQAAVNGMRQMEHASQQMDFYSKQLGIQNQQLGLQEKRANIANAQAQRANAVMEAKMKANQLQVRNGLNGAVQAEYDRQRNQIAAITSNNMLQPEEKARQIQELQQGFQSQLMQYRGIAGSDYVDGLTKPFADMYKAGTDFATGKTTADIYQHQLDSAQAKALLPFAADPDMARDLAATKLLGNNTPPAIMNRLSNALGQKMAAIAGGNGAGYNPTSPFPADKADTKTHTDILKSTINQLDQKSPLISDVPGMKDELHKNVNAILSGTVDFASSQKTPNQMNNVMDFLASPEFLKYKNMGGTIDPQVESSIENVVGTNYTDKLAPVVQQAWKDAQVTTGYTVDQGNPKYNVNFGSVSPVQSTAEGSLEYVFRNGALSFRPKKGFEANPVVIAKAKELNQKVAPLVNTTVKAAAHLNGNNDYESAFHKYEKDFFGVSDQPANENEVNGR